MTENRELIFYTDPDWDKEDKELQRELKESKELKQDKNPEFNETFESLAQHQQYPDISTHNGTIAIENPATGGHRTFKIFTAAKNHVAFRGQRVVAMLNGPDNETDYVAFGWVLSSGKIAIFGKYREVKNFAKFADMLSDPVRWSMQHGLIYHLEGTCRRCNRTLSTPESCRAGIGPECRKME